MKIDKILPEKSNNVALFELSATYCQDDPEKDDMEEIKISTSENGAGWFFVIETKKWSIEKTMMVRSRTAERIIERTSNQTRLKVLEYAEKLIDANRKKKEA